MTSIANNLTNTYGPNWDSPDNHAPSVSVITWLLAIIIFISVAARVATRYAVIREVRWDDATIVLALVRIPCSPNRSPSA